MQWQFLREVRAGQEKIKTRKKTVTDGCDCLFNYKLIIKNVYLQNYPNQFTALDIRENFLSQLFFL